MSQSTEILQLISDLLTVSSAGYRAGRETSVATPNPSRNPRKELLAIGAPALPYLIKSFDLEKVQSLFTEMGQPATDFLIEALRQPEHPQRKHIIDYIGKRKLEEASQALIHHLQHDPNDAVRGEAARALGAMNVAAAFEPIRNWQESLLARAESASAGGLQADRAELKLHQQAMLALARIDPKRAVRELSTVLEQTTGDLKRAVASVLSLIREPTAIAALIEQLNGRDHLLMAKEFTRANYSLPEINQALLDYYNANANLPELESVRQALVRRGLIA